MLSILDGTVAAALSMSSNRGQTMKLLLFSDLHADVQAARHLGQRAHAVDVLVGAGDFGNVRRQVHICIEVLRGIDKPAVLVAGNNESTEELTEACRSWSQAHVLHGSTVTIAGMTFFGLGGGIPVTPFGSWSYDFTEEQATELLVGCPKGCVLVSHSPPKGAVDVDSRGRSLGSVAVRDAVLRLDPLLLVCGHIHACAGHQARLGCSPVVNAGPTGVEWDL
ncbi:MAG TPA: metallophosphoesterase [Gemmataceae bacterium]|nr:metallophosphoesterase [Gemmataceae bacterium]